MAPKIAIIGAGPGGCMLARLLDQHSIPCTIFEGDKSVDYRGQGGTLDLRAKTGLQAVKEAGLWEEFQKHARYDGESMYLCDKNSRAWLKIQSSKPGEKKQLHEAPEIDRAVLRKMLMDSVPEGVVRWGYRLKRVEDDLSMVFENGETARGYDLIVGADGAWSKTRNLLSSEKPFYTGLGGYRLSIPDGANTAPELNKLVNRGSVFSFSDFKSINCQQMGDGSFSVATYGFFPEDFTKTCGFDTTNIEAVKRHLRKELHGWSPKLRDIFEKTEGSAWWRTLHMLPVGFKWEHRKGITLLGDAAHLMVPFAGIGVNNALHDAIMLSRRIVEYMQAGETGDLDNYIKDYEEEMFKVSKKAAALSEGCMNDMFSPGAPRTKIESYVSRHAKSELPTWIHPIVTAVVYTIYFFIKLFY